MLVRAAGNVLKGLSGAHMGMERWVRRLVLSCLSCHHGLMNGSHGKVWSSGVGLHLEARWKNKGILLLLPCPHLGGGSSEMLLGLDALPEQEIWGFRGSGSHQSLTILFSRPVLVSLTEHQDKSNREEEDGMSPKSWKDPSQVSPGPWIHAPTFLGHHVHSAVTG